MNKENTDLGYIFEMPAFEAVQHMALFEQVMAEREVHRLGWPAGNSDLGRHLANSLRASYRYLSDLDGLLLVCLQEETQPRSPFRVYSSSRCPEKLIDVYSLNLKIRD